ncbi:RNA polymerase sigma-70 factor [Bacteroides sp. f07]|uniref:RNA polymerase sigma-70 factor n=1 Tax=Bacteroides sp. f07 TaxID=3132704 RepID=UPI0036F43495
MIDNNNQVENKFSALFLENYSKIRKYAYRLLKSEYDAEDVAQDVFVKLWEQQEIWVNNERKLDSYLLVMTKNIALNILKHQRIKQEYQERFVQEFPFYELANNDNFWADIYHREMLQNIYILLETVPERRRSIFKLSRFRGVSHKEIACKMNISVHTVERQIYLTQLKLREVFLLI